MVRKLDGDVLIKEFDIFNLMQSQIDSVIFLLKQLDFCDSDLEKVMANLRESTDLLGNYV